MIADLVARALELSVTWWLTMSALVALTVAMLVWWASAYGDERDREGWRR